MIIDFDSFMWLIFAVFYAGIAVFLRFKLRKTFAYMFFFTIFFIYLVEVLKYTQFPIYLSKYMRAEIGQTVWRDMNLIPLAILGYAALKTSLLNILLIVPFGFGLPFISSLRLRYVVIAGMLFSILLESLQLAVALIVGFTFRFVDINDVIFNTIGIIIGYILFIGFVRVFRLALDRWHIPQNVILRYIYERPQVFDLILPPVTSKKISKP